MNSKVKGVLAVLVMIGVISGVSVLSYKKGLAKGYAVMDGMSKLAASANKYSHDQGYREGEMEGFKNGSKATEMDYCGYAEMMARASQAEVSRLHGVNAKYARSAEMVDLGDTETNNINSYIKQAAKEECKHFTAEQIDKLVELQKKGM